MKQLWSQFFIGALVPSFALMPCLLTPSDRPLQTGTTWYVSRCRSRKQTFLEIAQMCEAACVCLRLRVRAHGDEHQKAFFELLGEEAFHFGYVMLASDSIPAVCPFNWKLDTSDGRSTASTQQTIQDFLCSPGLATLVPRLGSKLYFGSCLTSLVRGGVCRNCTALLTTWRSWPVPLTTLLLLWSEAAGLLWRRRPCCCARRGHCQGLEEGGRRQGVWQRG